MQETSSVATSRRACLAGLLFAGSLYFGAWVAPVAAQVTTVETVPPEVDDDGRTAGERVGQVVVTLRILGVTVLVATAGFWWRTRPVLIVEPTMDKRLDNSDVPVDGFDEVV